MWVLILTIAVADYHTVGPAVHSIPNFSTRDSCLSAGNAWLDQIRPALNTYTRAHAVCVEQPK